MTDFPRTTKALREALSARGVVPTKRHGQCFLTDAQAVDAIVRDAEISPGDHVIEVGTGTGLLTHALCEAGASVDSFDIDARVLEVAKGLRDWPESVRFHAEDALAGKHALSSALLAALATARSAGVGRAKFVSNLPYNAATPVLLGLLSLPDPPDAITAMVQLEMGEKLLAGPGSDSYGAPSVSCGLLATGRILRRFPPQVFWPRPTVMSALIRLVPIRPPPLAPGEDRPFSDFVVALFTRRRKVIATALRAARPDLLAAAATALCAAAGIDPKSRPEDVAPAGFLRLWRAGTVQLRV